MTPNIARSAFVSTLGLTVAHVLQLSFHCVEVVPDGGVTNLNIEASIALKLDGILLVKSSRALSTQAQVLLMGEPLVNLDPPHQTDWLEMVRAMVAGGTTVIGGFHEITRSLQADSMVVACQGRVTNHGVSGDPCTRQGLVNVFDQRIAIYPMQGQWVALMHDASTV